MRTAVVAAVVGTALVTSLSGVTAAQAAPSGGTYQGCPYGYVCIYPRDAGWNGGHPSLKYYTYGAHNLSGQYGNHYVFNNQSGGASVTLDKGYNGASPVFDLNAYSVTNYNLTPINSVTLIR